MPRHKIDSSGRVLVDKEYFFNDDMKACPVGVDVQLLTRYGRAIRGSVTSRDAHLYRGWAPMPKVRKGQPPTSEGAAEKSIEQLAAERDEAVAALKNYVAVIARAGGGDKQLFMAAIRDADKLSRAVIAKIEGDEK